MKITITINCDSQAFTDTSEGVNTVLMMASEKIKACCNGTTNSTYSLADSYGNWVGTIKRTGKPNRHPEVGSV